MMLMVQTGDVLVRQHMLDVQKMSPGRSHSSCAPEPVWLAIFLAMVEAVKADPSTPDAAQLAKGFWTQYSRWR